MALNPLEIVFISGFVEPAHHHRVTLTRVKGFQADLTFSEDQAFFMQWAFEQEDICVYTAVKMSTCVWTQTNAQGPLTLMVFVSDNGLGGSSVLQEPWWQATKTTCGCRGLGLLSVCPPACAVKGNGAAWPRSPRCSGCQSSCALAQFPPSNASSPWHSHCGGSASRFLFQSPSTSISWSLLSFN